jgi:hypothetical protein
MNTFRQFISVLAAAALLLFFLLVPGYSAPPSSARALTVATRVTLWAGEVVEVAAADARFLLLRSSSWS